MKIYSEKTGKEYKSVDECLEAEKAFDEEIAAKKAAEEKALAERKAKQEALVAERKEAAEKVEKARLALVEAQNTFNEELTKFCEKWGAYHYTVKPGDKSWFDMFDNFFNQFESRFWF